ncbi:hypothetical protein ZEAMMB73_Zm00001d026579 [Zea mays]|uniref:RAB6A-GEF complex partner protein 2 n=1 Tax=Zea mays TaxID=4577 RepID=A0A1D6JHL6_MAIZE|nr:hypothetical protein ZEAMMB73_Zm00001d026579 [Zea mays]
MELPKILPPSYRGISIRYFYYVRTKLFGRPVVLGNGDQYKGLVNSAIQLSKANDNADLEEGYDSSKDEVSSVSSYNPSKANREFSLGSSLSTQSLSSRLSTSEPFYNQVERPNFPSYSPIPGLSVSEISDDHDGGSVAPQRNLNLLLPDHPSNGQRVSPDFDLSKDDVGLPLTPKNVEPAGYEGFTRGRSYNIRIDDQVSITLETSETINPRALHPSRRGSPTVTKLHSEHHEVVSDLHHTSFLFSIPIDGPMSFSTSKVTVQWSLRFEFFTTPEGTDPARYEHPLLVEKREKGEWVLPVTVYAPPLHRRATRGRNDRSGLPGNILDS